MLYEMFVIWDLIICPKYVHLVTNIFVLMFVLNSLKKVFHEVLVNIHGWDQTRYNLQEIFSLYLKFVQPYINDLFKLLSEFILTCFCFSDDILSILFVHHTRDLQYFYYELKNCAVEKEIFSNLNFVTEVIGWFIYYIVFLL